MPEANSPRVTVVVPTYNSAWSIGRTLLSVQCQTMCDFEVIVVNDGSTDALAEVVDPFLADSRFRLIQQSNSGLAASRNRGIREANAPLVAPIDADDIWHPRFLAEMVEALDLNTDAPFAYAYSFRMDEYDVMYPYVPFSRPPRHDLTGLLSLNSVACGSAAVFRRDLVLHHGGYDVEMGKKGLPGAEDWKLILRLARQSAPVLVEQLLVGYRDSPTSMSRSQPARQHRAVLAVIDDIAAETPELPPRLIADARTMITAWLLPAYARRGMVGPFVEHFVRAYVLNPLWFLNPLVREAHVRWLLSLWRSFPLVRRHRGPRHLWDVEVEKGRPFEFLRMRAG